MAKVWQSSDVTAGADITHTQYNNVRLDIIDAHKTSAPIGSIIMWAGSDANVPDGWALCNGSAVSRTTYSDLYTLTGNTFGAGNGSTTFNLPDMRDRFVVGAGSTYSRNGKGGSTSVTLTTANLAAHTHTGPSHRHTVSITSSTESRTHTHEVNMNFRLTNTGTGYASWRNSGTDGNYHSKTSSTESRTHTHSVSGNTGYQGTGNTGSAGSSSAHENRPPYIGLFFIIRTINN